MESFPKVLLAPAGEFNPSHLDDDGQWEGYDNKLIIGSNISATSSYQSPDVLESILSAPQYNSPNVTFSDDVDFTKVTTDDKLFYDIPELYTRKFDKYNVFLTSPAVVPFGTNYVYAATLQLISSV